MRLVWYRSAKGTWLLKLERITPMKKLFKVQNLSGRDVATVSAELVTSGMKSDDGKWTEYLFWQHGELGSHLVAQVWAATDTLISEELCPEVHRII